MPETTLDWRDLPAGRELDALVAERGVGLRPRPRFEDDVSRRWWCGAEHATPWGALCRECEILRAYSDDEAAALDLIETLGVAVRVERSTPEHPWYVWLDAGYGEGETFALAVSRAALAHVEERDAG